MGALTAASYARLKGANDRVGVGFIGFGLIGAQHVHDFKNQKDADLAALCDVYQPRLEQGVAACGGRARGYRDFRQRPLALPQNFNRSENCQLRPSAALLTRPKAELYGSVTGSLKLAWFQAL